MQYSKNLASNRSATGTVCLVPKDPDYLTLTGFESVTDAENVAKRLGLMSDQYTIYAQEIKH